MGIGWILGSSPLDSSAALGSSPGHAGKVEGHSPGSSLPLPQIQHPSYELLNRNGFQQMKYDRWRQRCLEERSHTGKLLLGGVDLKHSGDVERCTGLSRNRGRQVKVCVVEETDVFVAPRP